MTKYRIWFDEIERVEIDRETAASVFIGSRRKAKISDGGGFFDTFNDAKRYWVLTAEGNVGSLRRRLKAAERDLVKAMAYDESSVAKPQ